MGVLFSDGVVSEYTRKAQVADQLMKSDACDHKTKTSYTLLSNNPGFDKVG